MSDWPITGLVIAGALTGTIIAVTTWRLLPAASPKPVPAPPPIAFDTRNAFAEFRARVELGLPTVWTYPQPQPRK